jgi:hypothetical protein
MTHFFSSSNRDWQPALVLYSWSNRVDRAAKGCSRDPTKQPNPWRDRAAVLIQLILIHLYRVLSLAGVPFSSAFRFSIWLASGATAIGSEFRRLASAFIGYQNQRISRKWHPGDFEVLAGLRRWHITLGMSSPDLFFAPREPRRPALPTCCDRNVVAMCTIRM